MKGIGDKVDKEKWKGILGLKNTEKPTGKPTTVDAS